MITTTRREALSGLGYGLLTLLAKLPALPVGASSECSFPSLGLSVEIPQGWKVLTAQDVAALFSQSQLVGGDEALEELLDMGGDMVLTTAPSVSSEPGPMIQVWRQKAESWHHKAEDRLGIASAQATAYRDYANFFEGYSFEQEPQPSFFAGRPASATCVQFDNVDLQGLHTRVRLESHLLRWQDSWLTFNRADVLAGWTRETRSAFDGFEASIRFRIT